MNIDIPSEYRWDLPEAFVRILLMASVTALLGGCVSTPAPAFPEPLRSPRVEPTVAEGTTPEAEGAAMKGGARPRLESGPSTRATPVVAVDRNALPKLRKGPRVTLTLDAVNLTGFINEVFGNQLGLSVEIDQAVRAKSDQISLRLITPESRERVYVIAREVLQRYGVAIEEGQGLLRFVARGVGEEPPRLLTGRDLPAASGQQPIFVVVPLDVSEPGRVAANVRNLFAAQPNLKLSEMMESNALLVSGPPAVVQAAMETIAVLDQAAFREKHSLRINPLYLGAAELAKELKDLLVAQGYSVRTGAGTSGVITLVPVPSANALILFSESQAALDAAGRWAESLDQPADEAAGDGGVYLYAARHTTVESLRGVLEALMGADGASGAAPAATGAGAGASDGGAARGAAATRSAPTTSSVVVDGSRLVVDPVRNTIIFQGDAQRWRALQGVLARLDQPARQVVIEVTVAEVTLNDELSHGIEWALREANLGDFGGPLTALAGAGSANPAGLIWRPLSSSGQVKAVLNAFAKNSRVSILSTPRLMVRSGETARIDVGTEVPIITSQATAPDLGAGNGNSPSILQQVQYRKTGVLLEIEAVVHSGQRVDLRVSQEVSEAQPTDTSEISSPSIFSRKLETALSLSDGDSYLLGGLISSSTTRGGSEVPGLGRIPLLGGLFRNNRNVHGRTELLLLITPYVVEDAAQAKEITEAIRQRFEAATR